MRKMMACMLGAALCFSMAGAETGVSSAEKASPLFGRMIWNRGWEFRLEDEPGKSGWQTVHLPHTFSLPYFMSDSFYTGFGSYRKKLVMPEEWQGKKVFLDCGAAFQVAEVKVNGKTAGRHEGGYTAFRSDLTPFLKPGENWVEVRVDNRWSPRIAPRAGEHTFSGGLYRNVHLHVCSPVYLPAHGVWVQTPEVTAARGKVRILTEVKNDTGTVRKVTVRHTVREEQSGCVVLRGEKGAELGAGEDSRVQADLPPLASPRLWSPAAPNMYRVTTELLDEKGKVLDRAENPLGFRTLELTADRGMLINGKPVYLQGANVHQDHAGWGDAVTDAGARRDVRLMKNAGFNFIRGSHYPHSQAFLDACDREGMCMLNEGIFWGMGGFKEHDRYWNCDAYPAEKKDRIAFEESCMRQVREMVLQFRKQPKALTKKEDMLKLNPKLEPMLPGLSTLFRHARVSPYYGQIYVRKQTEIRKNLASLLKLLDRHNYYDTETILETTYPDTGRKLLWLQSEMDVVSDGSDGDRLAAMPDKILKSSFYQPSTSYRWKKRTDKPNPLLKPWQQRLASYKKTLEKAPAAEKTALRRKIDHAERVIEELKRYSFLISEYDPFIVVPLGVVNQSTPFSSGTMPSSSWETSCTRPWWETPGRATKPGRVPCA